MMNALIWFMTGMTIGVAVTVAVVTALWPRKGETDTHEL